VLFSGIFSLATDFSHAQGDTTYYVSYRKMLTTRLYTSRKYTSLVLQDNLSDTRMRFEPNTNLNLGVGASYNDFTLNIAVGFPFMNPNMDRVDGRYLDLQGHVYPRNFVIDFFGQFYNGYYLQRINGQLVDDPDIMVFPDMRVRKFGANVQYLFNGDRLSLKASFLQTGWQKKSAGSLLGGFEMYGGHAENPYPIPFEPDNPLSREFTRVGFLQFGPNIGYVATLVIKKHFFLTGLVSSSMSFGFSNVEQNFDSSPQWNVTNTFFLRGFAGYNGPVWSINANYVHANLGLPRVDDFANQLMTGNYRINFIYRFDVGPKLKKYLDYVDLERYLPEKLKKQKED
jgi:hypothetical protein